MLKKVSYEGMDFEYDAQEAKSYRNLKRIARAKEDMTGFFDAFEAIFAGRDEEYAELLGNDFAKLGELVSVAIGNEGEPVKN